MRFKLISTGNCSFSVVLADVRSAKQLNITELELEDPALISRESVISEIRERTGKFFTCEESINLEIDEKTEKEISKTFLHNKFVFESE
ncbi:unknown [Clostridium sp. CAG:470]|nr:MAG: hypothetical protein BHW03_04805 [Clostridium sp. 28_17]CDE14022.1 unknown [Clostridium sp. CAG:470]